MATPAPPARCPCRLFVLFVCTTSICAPRSTTSRTSPSYATSKQMTSPMVVPASTPARCPGPCRAGSGRDARRAWRAQLAKLFERLDQIPRDMVPGTEPGVLDLAGTTIGDVICFEVAYDGLVHDVIDDGGPDARRPDQQRHLHGHRPGRAAVRDRPAPGHRDRPLRRGRRHQRRLAASSRPTARSSPRAAVGTRES